MSVSYFRLFASAVTGLNSMLDGNFCVVTQDFGFYSLNIETPFGFTFDWMAYLGLWSHLFAITFD